MALGQRPSRAAKKPNEPVASFHGTDGWARVTLTAGTVQLPSGDPCYSDLRPFSAPDWSIAIPDGDRSAFETSPFQDSSIGRDRSGRR